MSVTPFRFFTLTYLLSWLIWIPLALSHFGIGPFHIADETSNGIRLLGVLMPAVSALFLTARSDGRDGLRTLLSRLVLWRVDWKYWIAATLVQPILILASALTFNLFAPTDISPAPTASAGALIVNIIFLLIATLGEEVGWRGVALPALQQKHSALKATLVLALLWLIWHLPFWMLLDTYDQFGVSFIGMNLLFGLPLAFYMTWFFNHTSSSLLLPVAFHLTFNIVNTILYPVTTNIGVFWILIAFEWLVALMIVPRLGAGAIGYKAARA